MSTTYTVDRISDGVAVLEDSRRQQLSLPVGWLPEGAREGDVLQVTATSSGGVRTVTFAVDAAATQERLEEARELREQLPKGPSGDLDL